MNDKFNTILAIVLFCLYFGALFITFFIGLFNITDAYRCPEDTIILYRSKYCSYINGTQVQKEYFKDNYDNGVIVIGIFGGLAVLGIIVCTIMCIKTDSCCYCDCDCLKNKNKNKNNCKPKYYENNTMDII